MVYVGTGVTSHRTALKLVTSEMTSYKKHHVSSESHLLQFMLIILIGLRDYWVIWSWSQLLDVIRFSAVLLAGQTERNVALHTNDSSLSGTCFVFAPLSVTGVGRILPWCTLDNGENHRNKVLEMVLAYSHSSSFVHYHITHFQHVVYFQISSYCQHLLMDDHISLLLSKHKVQRPREFEVM